ncbi:MAG: serine/threonine-protein kinase [Polyangiaceae bacterium]
MAYSGPALPNVGDTIAGKYELVRVLGEGGMGIVFEAMHVRMRTRVAVKMLLPAMLAHDDLVARFEREARAAGQLRSRHAARVVDVDVLPSGLPYMVMEFLEGHDLQSELEARNQFPPQEAVDYVLQASVAMGEAHALGIIHRDLKPSNMFLTVEDERRVVKILDFGISKVQSDGDAKLTAAETVMGTAMYMSPEQVKSASAVDGRADVWSLGVILYELITGRPPWLGSATQVAAAIVSEDAPDIRTLSPTLAPGLAAAIHHALIRDLKARTPTVRALIEELVPFAAADSVGRAAAEQILQSSQSQPFIRSQLPSSAHTADTAVALPVGTGREADGATAPGWSQHSHANRKGTRVLTILGGLAALVLIGVGAFIVTRTVSSSSGAATQTAPEGVQAATSVLPPSSVEPPPPAVDPPADPPPAPPATQAAQATAPKPATRPPVSKPHAGGAPPKPAPVKSSTPPPKPKPASTRPPLFLP